MRSRARQMADFGGMVSFRVGSPEKALDVASRTELFFLAESLGGVESLIEVPGPMTHASVAGLSARGARRPRATLGRHRAPRRPDRGPRPSPLIARRFRIRA